MQQVFRSAKCCDFSNTPLGNASQITFTREDNAVFSIGNTDGHLQVGSPLKQVKKGRRLSLNDGPNRTNIVLGRAALVYICSKQVFQHYAPCIK